jgi:hypothetical protein
MLRGLYYPDRPLRVLRSASRHPLGRCTSSFLGKVIRLTAGHQAKVEESRRSGSLGGVFYTPTRL